MFVWKNRCLALLDPFLTPWAHFRAVYPLILQICRKSRFLAISGRFWIFWGPGTDSARSVDDFRGVDIPTFEKIAFVTIFGTCPMARCHAEVKTWHLWVGCGGSYRGWNQFFWVPGGHKTGFQQAETDFGAFWQNRFFGTFGPIFYHFWPLEPIFEQDTPQILQICRESRFLTVFGRFWTFWGPGTDSARFVDDFRGVDIPTSEKNAFLTIFHPFSPILTSIGHPDRQP